MGSHRLIRAARVAAALTAAAVLAGCGGTSEEAAGPAAPPAGTATGAQPGGDTGATGSVPAPVPTGVTAKPNGLPAGAIMCDLLTKEQVGAVFGAELTGLEWGNQSQACRYENIGLDVQLEIGPDDDGDGPLRRTLRPLPEVAPGATLIYDAVLQAVLIPAGSGTIEVKLFTDGKEADATFLAKQIAVAKLTAQTLAG
jgi:hypothetical protein